MRRMLAEIDLNLNDKVRREFLQICHQCQPCDLPEELRGLAYSLAAVLGEEKRLGDHTDANSWKSDELRPYECQSTGNRRLARRLYERALMKEKAEPRRARLRLALASLALADGNIGEVEGLLGDVEAIAREQDLQEVLWRCLRTRGQAASEIVGDDTAAEGFFEESAIVLEQQRTRLRKPVERNAYDLHRMATMRQLLRGAGRRRDAPAFFHLQELERGRLLFDLWATSSSDRKCVAPTCPPE